MVHTVCVYINFLFKIRTSFQYNVFWFIYFSPIYVNVLHLLLFLFTHVFTPATGTINLLFMDIVKRNAFKKERSSVPTAIQ